MDFNGTPNLRSTRRGSVVEIVLEGDLDMPAAFRLEPAIEDLMAAPGVRAVTLDLAAVGFIDSTGLGALLSLRERADRLTVEFQVARASAAVHRIIELTGTRSMLGV